METIVTIELKQIANGVLLEITNDARPSISDPLAQRRLQVGPLYFQSEDEALDSMARLTRTALAARRELDAKRAPSLTGRAGGSSDD